VRPGRSKSSALVATRAAFAPFDQRVSRSTQYDDLKSVVLERHGDVIRSHPRILELPARALKSANGCGGAIESHNCHSTVARPDPVLVQEGNESCLEIPARGIGSRRRRADGELGSGNSSVVDGFSGHHGLRQWARRRRKAADRLLGNRHLARERDGAAVE
jgi:hypothetical protein